jgi:glycosyltransferase involved in cell wall biosynthesis
MHILEIPSLFPPFGGLFCLDQAKALSLAGHEVRILSNVQLSVRINRWRYLTYPYGRHWMDMDGILVYQSYQRGIPKLIRPNVKRWVSIVRSMFEDYMRQYGKPDILHAHAINWAGYAAMLIGRDYHIPYVVTEHSSRLVFESEYGPAPSDTWQIPMLREAYKHAARVIPVSEELVDNIACYFGNDYQWTAISNVVDVDFFHYQQRSPLQERPFRFCCIANNLPTKGYDVLLPAFKLLHQHHPNVELYMAGYGTGTKAFRSQLDTSCMYAYGKVDKKGVRDLLYQCDAFVLASRSEAQPLVLLEAMSTGIPVIATECTPRSLRIEDSCTIVPIGNVEALFNAMKKLAEQPQFDGHHLVEEVHRLASPVSVGHQLEDLFRAIVSK